jgi:hypothetical protein
MLKITNYAAICSSIKEKRVLAAVLDKRYHNAHKTAFLIVLDMVQVILKGKYQLYVHRQGNKVRRR